MWININGMNLDIGKYGRFFFYIYVSFIHWGGYVDIEERINGMNVWHICISVLFLFIGLKRKGRINLGFPSFSSRLFLC